MRRYETMVIIDPEIPEQDRSGLFDRLGELITGQSGYLVECDEWGTRKLAYEIKKKPRGYYARLDYCGSGELVRELERNFRIDDRFLKYMTVLLDEEVDVEALKEEAARKKAEKAAEQEAASAESETPSASEAPATAEAASKPEAEAAPEPEAEAASKPEAEAAPKPEAEAESEPEAPAPSGESEEKEGA